MINWDDARFFLALAREGTLRGAAGVLGVDQATVGRRITTLEQNLDSKLFIRTPRCYDLSRLGEAMLADASLMEQAIRTMERRASGGEQPLCGEVRITTTDTLAQAIVLPALALLGQQHPGICLNLQTATSLSDLAAEETDLTIWSMRPDDDKGVIKHLTTLEMGLYAAQHYLTQQGTPKSGLALSQHALLLLTNQLVAHHWHSLCGEPLHQPKVVLQCNTQLLLLAAARQGLGIALLPAFLADQEPTLVRVLPTLADPVDIWLDLPADRPPTAQTRALVAALEARFHHG